MESNKDGMKNVGTSAKTAISIEDILSYMKPETAAKVDTTAVELAEDMDVDNTCQTLFQAFNGGIKKMKLELATIKQENETKTELLKEKTVRCDALEAELARSAGMVNLMAMTISVLTRKGMATTQEVAGGMDSQTQDLVPGGQPELTGGSREDAGPADHIPELQNGSGASEGLFRQSQRLANCQGAAGMAAGAGVSQGVVCENKNESTTDDVDRCRDWRSKNGCRRGTSCKWSHPAGKGRLAGRKECTFWLAGKCKYSEDHCNRGTHTIGKQGTQSAHLKCNRDQVQKKDFRSTQAITRSHVMAGAPTLEMTAQLLLLQLLQGGLAAPLQ